MEKLSDFSIAFQHLLSFVFFLMIAFQVGMKSYPVVSCISLMTSAVEHIFMYFLANCIASWKKCLFKILANLRGTWVAPLLKHLTLGFGMGLTLGLWYALRLLVFLSLSPSVPPSLL